MQGSKNGAKAENLAEEAHNIEEVIVKGKKLTQQQKKYLEFLDRQFTKRRLQMSKRRIKQNWRAFFEVKELSKERLLLLSKYRKETLEYANIATMKVKVTLKNGEVKSFEYIAHSGRGNKIENSVSSPNLLGNKKMFLDSEHKVHRWYDSENKMLVQMDKDLAQLRMTSAKVEIRLESTYEPCTICKRELDIRRNYYKANVKVEHPYIKNIKGKLQGVKGHNQLKKVLKNN